MVKSIGIIGAIIFLLNGSLSGQESSSPIVITKADIEKVQTSIPVSAIGEPVGSVK